jgi:hypothetical protein
LICHSVSQVWSCVDKLKSSAIETAMNLVNRHEVRRGVSGPVEDDVCVSHVVFSLCLIFELTSKESISEWDVLVKWGRVGHIEGQFILLFVIVPFTQYLQIAIGSLCAVVTHSSVNRPFMMGVSSRSNAVKGQLSFRSAATHFPPSSRRSFLRAFLAHSF